MPYKITSFLFVFFVFCTSGYANCSSEEIAKIIKNPAVSNYHHPKITYISKDDKCRFTLNYYGGFLYSYVFVNSEAINDGPRIWWYDNGQKKSEINFSMDKITGLGTTWHRNGIKQSEENYKDNIIDGRVSSWNDKGEKISELIYENGFPKTDQTSSVNEPKETSNQDPIEIAKDTCKKLGLKEKTEKFGVCVLELIN